MRWAKVGKKSLIKLKNARECCDKTSNLGKPRTLLPFLFTIVKKLYFYLDLICKICIQHLPCALFSATFHRCPLHRTTELEEFLNGPRPVFSVEFISQSESWSISWTLKWLLLIRGYLIKQFELLLKVNLPQGFGCRQFM